MTRPRDHDALLSAYLDDGMTVLPDRVVDAVLHEVHRTRQRGVVGPWATPSVSRTTLAAAAVVTMLALAGALLLVGGGPRPVPSDQPGPSPQGVVDPSSTPSTSPAAPTASPVTDPAGLWIPTGTMGTPRAGHSAVRLLDGRVLVIGADPSSGITSAELYDPASGTWSATESPSRLASDSSATLLRDGRVLVRVADDTHGANVSAEVYDPTSGTWTATGQMVRAADHGGDTATSLADGRVLVAGLNGAQLYDPGTGTWTATGKMNTPRFYHTATLLPDGRVLAAGGYLLGDVQTDVAELYDPNTGSWTAIASMQAPHRDPTATLLRDGTVLVAGWSDNGNERQFAMEVYDPAAGTWNPLPSRPEIGYRTATLLSDGRLLVTGLEGARGSHPPCTAAELYDPGNGSWTMASSMLRCGNGSSFTLLLDDSVLAAGGMDCPPEGGVCVGTDAAVLYVPVGASPPALPAFPNPLPPAFPSPTPIPSAFPPQAGPVPANARAWTVTVGNESSGPATLFLAEDGENGIGELCASVTPHVVAAGATQSVTFLLPPKDVKGCWIWVNPVPGQGGSLLQTSDAPLAGQIFIDAGGQAGWSSP